MIEDHASSLPTTNLYIVHHSRERLPLGQQGDQPAWADRILQGSSHTLSQDSLEKFVGSAPFQEKNVQKEAYINTDKLESQSLTKQGRSLTLLTS